MINIPGSTSHDQIGKFSFLLSESNIHLTITTYILYIHWCDIAIKQDIKLIYVTLY